MSSNFKITLLPAGNPLYGLVVLQAFVYIIFFALEPKPLNTPFSNPDPIPNTKMSIKIPQKTPSAVSPVRNLCLRMVPNISCHLSLSNMLYILFKKCMSIDSINFKQGLSQLDFNFFLHFVYKKLESN